MSTYVLVKQSDLTFVSWALWKVERDIGTWGMLSSDSRSTLKQSIADIRAVLNPLTVLREPEIASTKLRALVALLERLSSALHSARKVMTEDRRRALGLIAQARKRLHAYIQLNLFGDRES